MTSLPVQITQDVDTRIVVENRDGVLVALVQRRVDGEWTTFGEASGADGTILIRPA